MKNSAILNWPVEAIRSEIISMFKLDASGVNTSKFNQWLEAACVRANTHLALVENYSKNSIASLPLLNEHLMKIPLEVSHAHLLITRPRVRLSQYHVDGRRAAINIPIFNCNVGCVEWSAAKNVKREFHQTKFSNYSVPEIDIEPLGVEEQAVLNCVLLINTGHWHRVNVIDNPYYRVIFSVRFTVDPTFEQLKELLQGSII